MLNFPSSPSVGQVFSVYRWDGEKWIPDAAVSPLGYPPSATNPLMNGTVLPGLSYSYARGDHVHPTDTSRAPTANASLTGTTTAAAASVSGNVSVSGILTVGGDGSLLGLPAGTGQPAAIALSDANIILYNNDASNWAGIGTDVNGRWWIRTGLSGSPSAAFYIDQSRNAFFLKSPTAPTPAAADNSLKLATTAFVAANPASGPYVLLNSANTMTGMLTVAGDLRTYRSDATGVIFLGNTGGRYLYYNGSNYTLPGAHANSANGRLWGSADFAQPIINIRLVYLGDPNFAENAALSEPYGGGCLTGYDGWIGGMTHRFRQFQIQLGNGTWAAVGYA